MTTGEGRHLGEMPRGICKVCGRNVAVKRDGTLRGHGGSVYNDRPWCAGSMERGWKPERPRQ